MARTNFGEIGEPTRNSPKLIFAVNRQNKAGATHIFIFMFVALHKHVKKLECSTAIFFLFVGQNTWYMGQYVQICTNFVLFGIFREFGLTRSVINFIRTRLD